MQPSKTSQRFRLTDPSHQHEVFVTWASVRADLFSLDKSDAAPPFMNLTVLRSPDIDRASRFYSEMGLLFTKHGHGSGPEHYSSCVDDVDSIVDRLVAIGAKLVSPPADSEWGRRAVVSACRTDVSR
jgi:hypothetical protein